MGLVGDKPLQDTKMMIRMRIEKRFSCLSIVMWIFLPRNVKFVENVENGNRAIFPIVVIGGSGGIRFARSGGSGSAAAIVAIKAVQSKKMKIVVRCWS